MTKAWVSMVILLMLALSAIASYWTGSGCPAEVGIVACPAFLFDFGTVIVSDLTLVSPSAITFKHLQRAAREAFPSLMSDCVGFRLMMAWPTQSEQERKTALTYADSVLGTHENAHPSHPTDEYVRSENLR